MWMSYDAPSKKNAKTPARESNSTTVEETPSSPGIHLLVEPLVAHSSPLAIQEDNAEGRFTPYVGLPFDFHRDLKV